MSEEYLVRCDECFVEIYTDQAVLVTEGGHEFVYCRRCAEEKKDSHKGQEDGHKGHIEHTESMGRGSAKGAHE